MNVCSCSLAVSLDIEIFRPSIGMKTTNRSVIFCFKPLDKLLDYGEAYFYSVSVSGTFIHDSDKVTLTVIGSSLDLSVSVGVQVVQLCFLRQPTLEQIAKFNLHT